MSFPSNAYAVGRPTGTAPSRFASTTDTTPQPISRSSEKHCSRDMGRRTLTRSLASTDGLVAHVGELFRHADLDESDRTLLRIGEAVSDKGVQSLAARVLLEDRFEHG